MKETRQLIGKTLLAALILLTLSGALLVPLAFSAKFDEHTPAPWVQTNVNLTGDVNASFTAVAPGYSFYVYVDANVSTLGLLNYQAGFSFNQTVLQVDNVTGNFPGSLIYSLVGGIVLEFPGSIDNVLGNVTAWGYSVDQAHAPTGYGHLLRIGMQINPALTHDAGPVPMVIFDLNPISPKALVLTDKDGFDIILTPSEVNDGYFTVSGLVPEFSSVLFATLLILATFAAALFGKATWSYKRKV